MGDLAPEIVKEDARNGIKVNIVSKPSHEELVKEIEEVICNLIDIQMAWDG